ncbi:TauD/TfdA family dioxygenase [Sedimenticola hydrogenitrophicus]|uniref:TauD/TfdA family dioxygenase n=1 Tax=Sedimenticola hydrogenitrophicus TaxID=2967975 RepID=UPI0021A6377E|nr:TauD/TfdA family dioxygenase [Sedimenticola hydrogenitrophicus]
MPHTAVAENPLATPFSLANEALYQSWRSRKLADYPASLEALLVPVRDPRQLTRAEFEAISQRVRKANMAIYISETGSDPDPEIPLSLGRQFGARHLNHNWLSDDTGLTSLKVAADGIRQQYIPYSNRPIKWHTDGYYNRPDEQIHSLILHCVQSAGSGGENALLDHEIAYILLRDQDPAFITALMGPAVMTIPPRLNQGEVARQEEIGPVLSIMPCGNLHMRYTIRTRHVIWSDDPLTRRALDALSEILASDSPYIFRGRLEPGMGLISNNILHDRTAFQDDEQGVRHLYRARYYDRLRDTGIDQYR